jgi:hypothetical protein
MMVFLICLAVLVVFALVVFELVLLSEEGAPPKDSDVLEMLEKYRNHYDKIRENYSGGSYYIGGRVSYEVKDIYKTKWSLLFPYYINGVGVIPAWYKSASQIETIFKELMKGSEFENKKRKKLGLD